MGQNVAEFILNRLNEWGVDKIYGYPGDGINGLLGAFHKVEKPEFIQVRHEEIASFAATAHAKFTGEVGVCMATSGPGAIHLLDGLYDGKLDHQPVVAIVGQQARTGLGANYQQEVDLQVLFKDVASEFVQYCMAPAQARHLVDRAMRVAKASRSVTCVIVPEDVQEAPYEEPPRQHGVVYTSVDGGLRPRVIPQESQIRRAAEILNSSQKVAILIGQGAAHAAAEVEHAADPINPQRIFHELSPKLPDDCILTADSGSATNWWARHLTLRRGMKAALSGTLATMCPAVPYALAAKFAYPDRPVIACLGDGAMQMLGINALIDIAYYHERWSNRQLIVLVLNNRDLNQVTWEQRVLAGDPKLDASQVLPDFPFARYAELLGLQGIRVDTPDRVAAAWDEALAADRPVLYEAITDPEVPPLPPHIRMDQAKHMAKAMVKGDPAAPTIAKQSLAGKLREFVER